MNTALEQSLHDALTLRDWLRRFLVVVFDRRQNDQHDGDQHEREIGRTRRPAALRFRRRSTAPRRTARKGWRA